MLVGSHARGQPNRRGQSDVMSAAVSALFPGAASRRVRYCPPMPYPARLLTEGEEIVYESKQHWIALRDEIAYTLIWLGLWILVVPWLDFALDEWIGWLVTLAWAVRVGLGVARWYSTILVFTTDRLIYRTGIMEKSGYEVRAARLVDVGFTQSLWQRMVGAGDLIVDTDSHPKTVIRDVPDPIGLSALMETRAVGDGSPVPQRRLPGEPTPPVEKNLSRPMPRQAERSSSRSSEARLTRAEQLEILARLHIDGKLTDEEFILEKRRVLETG